MDSSDSRLYIINHMDDWLYEWSLCEYLQINKYMAPHFKKTQIILSKSKVFLEFVDKEEKNIQINKENIEILKNFPNFFHFLKNDINTYINENFLTIPMVKDINQHDPMQYLDTTYTYHRKIEFQRICLLDMRSDEILKPEDVKNFDVFLFGGILGDHPPRDRTSHLRKKGFAIRSLGKLQMSTDTAVLVTKLIIENQRRYEDIPFIDEPEINKIEKMKKKGYFQESIQIEGFRYVKEGYNVNTAEEGENVRDEPMMSEKIKKELIFKELDINDFF